MYRAHYPDGSIRLIDAAEMLEIRRAPFGDRIVFEYVDPPPARPTAPQR
jgi:hypothetical protein